VRVVAAAGGTHHSLAVDDAGVCYSWGAGEARERTSESAGGWLGHRDFDDRPVPRPIAALGGARVVAVAAGGWHSLALADGGALYSFGDGGGGKLGHDDGGQMHWVPARVCALEGCRVAAIGAGEAHSLCMLEDGRVLSWGCGGALGLRPAVLTEHGTDNPACWGSETGYEWLPGDAARRWQAHAPSLVSFPADFNPELADC
jgi:alpha-tubulin suppressor-like RCC1 family protein